MLFRDGQKGLFPRQTITDKQVAKARETDYSKKEHRQQELNAAKYVKKDNFQIGNTVLIRNFNKRKKIYPLSLPEPYVVRDITPNYVLIKSERDGSYYKRHPDDIKLCNNFLNKSNSHKNDKCLETFLEPWNEFHGI